MVTLTLPKTRVILKYIANWLCVIGFVQSKGVGMKLTSLRIQS